MDSGSSVDNSASSGCSQILFKFSTLPMNVLEQEMKTEEKLMK